MNIRALLAAALSGILAAGVAWVIASRPDGRLHVTVLSTGSSPAVLVRTGDAALGRVLPPATAHLDMVVVTGGEQAAVNGLAGLPGHDTVGTVVTQGALNPGGNNIVLALETAGANVLEAAGGAWSFGGATWRCLGYTALATGRQMCALTVEDRTGRLLVLGDTGTADQDNLCAVYRSALGADLVVTPPGGAVSPLLLATARPLELAVPIVQGAPAAPAPEGYPTDKTSTDGDLSYIGGVTGLRPGP
jgi:beta-lactamase superfamily II metal-dependent hydrolase